MPDYSISSMLSVMHPDGRVAFTTNPRLIAEFERNLPEDGPIGCEQDEYLISWFDRLSAIRSK